ncbi:intein, partial [Methylosinus sp. sav-2]|uniref:polymorphic toxin-type HINT domain-containing protein n=1 Tax=Methylosinus sp. sav-2 TaxID=2485168 RepID=UPI0010F0CD12
TIDQAAVGAILGDGIVTTAEGTTALATGADAAFVAARSGSAVQKIGARIACTFFVLAAALSFANDPSLVGAYDLVTDMSSCAVKAVKKPQPPTRKSSPSPGCSISGFSSFEAGTPIETAQGRRPIEEIAIGDLVAARDGFTGEVGWRPVRELFRRTAPSIVHLTLDGPDGRRETLNVTSEHPFFVADKGWVEVRRLERGDRIVSEREATLAVADVSLEERSTLVYNFEVAQDHNYFVGDEGAEAHNAPGWFWKNVLNNTNTPNSIKGWIQTELARTKGDWSRIRNPPGMDCGHYPSNRGAHDPRSRLEWAAGNRARPAPYRKEPAMAIDRRHSNRVLSAAGLDGERLAQAISSGKIVFSEPAEPSSKEFVALINLANAERRSEKFTGEMLRFGKVLALEKNDTLIEFKIEDERGKVRSAVPFWPAEKYAAYARDALGLTTNIRELDILEYIFSVLAVDLPAKKLFAARFWLPSKRTVVDPPRILAKKHLESIAWYYKVESDPLASKMSDEEYRIALKDAYHRPMKCGPKGKLP